MSDFFISCELVIKLFPNQRCTVLERASTLGNKRCMFLYFIALAQGGSLKKGGEHFCSQIQLAEQLFLDLLTHL